jgi:TRAP-type C4-dicarboxylate transport system permease small subunit
MIYLIVSSGTRRKLAAISALAIIVTMLVAFPRTYDFVSFLQIKKSGTLRIPLAYIFSIYLVFMLSSIAIYGRGLLRLWRGQELSDSGAAGGIV